MKIPAQILRENGLSYNDLTRETGQTRQYVSMQLNDARPMTSKLMVALNALIDDKWIVGSVIAARGH